MLYRVARCVFDPGGVGPEFAITTGRQTARRRSRRRRERASAAVPMREASTPAVAIDGPRRVLPDRLRYLAGLDGLRALAVLAVLVYHADYSWLPGGFLGV